MLIPFSSDVLEKLEVDPISFCGNIIDLSSVPAEYAASLSLKLAEQFGLTAQELAVELVEKRIRKAAKQANIQIVGLWKDQTEIESGLLETLKKERIILLK